MLKAILLSSLILTVSCIPKEKAIISSPGYSSWDSNANPFPLQMKISEDFTTMESDDIKTASSSWKSSTDSNTELFDHSSTTSRDPSDLDSYMDQEMGVYKIEDWPSDLPSSALAITQIFGVRRNVGKSNEYIQIQHADILMNYDNFNFTGDYDFETVILHEMGHFLGLYHDNSSRSESVMYPSIATYTTNRTPKSNDVSKLKSLYNLSSASSVAAAFTARSRQPASAAGEPVVVIFELRADGSEKMTIQNRNREVLSQTQHNHKH